MKRQYEIEEGKGNNTVKENSVRKMKGEQTGIFQVECSSDSIDRG